MEVFLKAIAKVLLTFYETLALISCLAASLLIIYTPSAIALDKPTNLSATYNAIHDQVILSWDKRTGIDRYTVLVQTTAGVVVAKSSTKSPFKRFSGATFDRAREYRVLVQAVSGNSKSSFATKRYLHTLSRGAGKGKLLTTNASGRSGNFYLPAQFGRKKMPLLVGLHGQGGAGDSMVNAFASYAEKYGFIIVAPSSGVFDDGTASWRIGLSGTETPDFSHIKNCISELRSFDRVKIDEAKILAVGYSAGGAVAPYFATSAENSEITHFGVLHGGVVLSTLGLRRLPVWLSTGTRDPLRPPSELQGYKNTLQDLGFDALYTEYDTDHGLTKTELRSVVEWWLGR